MTTRRELLETEYASRGATTAISTGTKEFKPTEIAVGQLYDELGDLVNDEFKLWYYKHFKRLGANRTLILAAQARVDGKYPARLFSSLLKKA
jgi:hypothetical protein